MTLASGVEHGIFGGAKAKQISHLVAELGQVLPQVVEVLHRGLVRALHLLPRGRQVTMHQAAHDLLVVFVPFLLQVPPLLKNRTMWSNQIHRNTRLDGKAGGKASIDVRKPRRTRRMERWAIYLISGFWRNNIFENHSRWVLMINVCKRQ